MTFDLVSGLAVDLAGKLGDDEAVCLGCREDIGDGGHGGHVALRFAGQHFAAHVDNVMHKERECKNYLHHNMSGQTL